MSTVEQHRLQVPDTPWYESDWLAVAVIAGALLTIGVYACCHGAPISRRFRRKRKRHTDTELKLVKYRNRETVILLPNSGEEPPDVPQ